MKKCRTTGSRSPRLLPPIIVDSERASSSGSHSSLGSTCRSPKTLDSPPGYKLWSYYHRDCVKRDTTPKNRIVDEKRVIKNKDINHHRPRNLPLAIYKDNYEVPMKDYLSQNKEFLEDYVVKCVPLNEIEKWMFKKLSRTYAKEAFVDKQLEMKQCNTGPSDTKQIFMNLVRTLQEEPNEHAVVWELALSITSMVTVDSYKVYKMFPDHPNFVQYFVTDGEEIQVCPKNLERVDPKKVPTALKVAETGKPIRMTRKDHATIIPDTLFKGENENASHMMYQPIFSPSGKTAYVIEMCRANKPFEVTEEESAATYLVWGSLALNFFNLYLDKKRERNMSDFLLDVVKAIFEEMVSLDQLIKRILEFAQRLVNADRASLFLVDYRNFELVSTVFDLKFERGQTKTRDVEKKEIRMPINRGIAGHVALSGETMNIPDAYSDYRFNREVDEATGYKTVSILCMPIKVQGKVIGVVQMVNKRTDDSFHHEDETAFEIFSTFFGLALHHARLYDRIIRKEQKYKVALEVLSYHNTCRENEVKAIMGDKDSVDVNLNDFYLDPYQFNEFAKCKAVITMFNELFDMSKFDIMTVTRFVLTVKKNYRTVPYHNFDHGWSVAHAVYVIVKNDLRKRYNYNMRLALFVACLCHDLDHRGYTNKYMSETASPLAAMYTTSTLEHHHFNITVTILQQDGHNIFSHISSEEYKEILGFIRQCILATDLAAFFPNLKKLKELLEDPSGNKFTWGNDHHRDVAMAITMTAADLSASAKPWEVQIKTVKVIFEEFYDQGDKEREAGRVPIPMMDRNKPEEQPASQVGFLSQICIPCYNVLYRILPNTKPMYAMALKNLHNWKLKADRILRKSQNSAELSSDEEDISEEVFFEDQIEVVVEEEEYEIKGSSSHDEESIKSIRILNGRINEETVSDEDSAGSKEIVGCRLSNDIKGVTWIDEEGLVVKSNAIKIIKNEKP